MTAASSTLTRAPQWRRTLHHLLSSYVYVLTLWFWAVALPVVAIIVAVISQNVDQVTLSGVAFTHHGALWFPFSIAIIVSVTYLPIHVANGMTRTSFSQAAILVGLLVGVLNGLISTLALLLEEQIYHRLGWYHGGNSGELEVFHAGVLPYALGLVLLFTAGQCSGALVGITYYRLGALRGTLALPLTMLPIVVVSIIGLDQNTQWVPWGVGLGTPWGMLLGALLIAGSALVLHLLVRHLDIDSKD